MSGLRKMMYSSLKVSSGGSPVLIQAVNIKIDDTVRGTITDWNYWASYTSNSLNLKNSAGADTGISLLALSGTITGEDQGTPPSSSRFPSAVLKYLTYTIDQNATYRFTGLNPSNNYRLIFGTYITAGAGTESNTNIVINGLTTLYDCSTNGFHSISIDVNLPASGIINFAMNIIGSTGNVCLNGLILEEYNP